MVNSKDKKIDQIIEIIKHRKVIPSQELTEMIYGDSNPANTAKLHKLLSAYRRRGKSINIYCIRGNYIDISTSIDKLAKNSRI